MLNYPLVFLNTFSLPKKKRTKCELDTEESKFSSVKMISVHRPSIQDTKLLFKILKVIIIICMCVYVFVHSNVQRLLVCVCACTCVCIVSMYINVCLYIYVCVHCCMYIYEYV